MKTISLSQGQVTVVPDELHEQLGAYKWYAMRSGRTFLAVRNVCGADGKLSRIFMHHYIYQLLDVVLSSDCTLDHRDGNGLNNQLANLRVVTRAEISQKRGRRNDNSSGYIGVGRRGDRWQAYANVDGRQKFLGYFDDPFSAAWVRDEFVIKNNRKLTNLNNLVDRRTGTHDRRKEK